MLKRIIAIFRHGTQPVPLEHPPSTYREKSAYYLFLSQRPVGGLDWHELTDDQRHSWREAITVAASLTDATRRRGQGRSVWEYDANAEERVRR